MIYLILYQFSEIHVNMISNGSIVTNIRLIKLIHPAVIHSGQSKYDYQLTGNDTTVARLFKRCPKHNLAKFSGMEISILNFIHAPPTSRVSQDLRDIEEKCWIHRLASIVPRGLNLLD